MAIRMFCRGRSLYLHIGCYLLRVFNIAGYRTGKEVCMKQESIDYLDNVACIANANMTNQQLAPVHQRRATDSGVALLI